jgi:hypothetical protein
LYRTFIAKDGGSVASVLHFLKHRDLSGFNPKAHAPKTSAFYAMIDNLKSAEGRDMDGWLKQIREFQPGVELFTFAQWQAAVEATCDQEDDYKGVARTVAKARSNHKLNKLAKDTGLTAIGQKRITAGSRKQTSVFALVNEDHWLTATETEIAAQFEKQQVKKPA